MLLGKSFPLHEGSENHERSFTYVGDVVDAALRVADRHAKVIGEIINIGGGDVYTTAYGIQLIEELIGHKAELTRTAPRSGDQMDTQADTKKAKRLLDFMPKTTLEDGLQLQFEWHKNRLFPHLMIKANL